MSFIQPQARYRLNADPRLSANQLAEYLEATATRRKSIVRDAKFPKAAVVTQLKEARTSIAKLLTHPALAGETLVAAAERCVSRESGINATDWVRQDCKASLEAIDAFHLAQSSNVLGLGQFTFRPLAPNPPLLEISGVGVSVNLAATVHRTLKGVPRIGGVMLYLGRPEASAKVRKERGVTAALLTYLFCQEFLPELGKPDPALCFLLDVFGKAIIAAPARHKRLLGEVHLACEEIVLRWQTIDPPTDYDGLSP